MRSLHSVLRVSVVRNLYGRESALITLAVMNAFVHVASDGRIAHSDLLMTAFVCGQDLLFPFFGESIPRFRRNRAAHSRKNGIFRQISADFVNFFEKN